MQLKKGMMDGKDLDAIGGVGYLLSQTLVSAAPVGTKKEKYGKTENRHHLSHH